MFTRPRPAIIVLAISLAVLIITPIWLLVSGSGSSDNSIESAGQSRVQSSSESTDAKKSGPSPTIGTPVIDDAPPIVAAPATLSIPALNIETGIRPVGVDKDNQVVIPEDIDKVGWYKFGATPGSGQGSSVVVGHRDGRNYGKGAFYNLAALEPDDEVTITNAEGAKLTYRVIGRESIYKEELPIRELFREDGSEVLTLISCSGYYVPGEGYEQNVIVTAVPIAGT